MTAHTLTFDTLAFAKRLESAGITQQQAEAQAEALASVFGSFDVATKKDLETFSIDVDSKLSKVEAKLITWIVGLLFAQTAIIISLIKFLH